MENSRNHPTKVQLLKELHETHLEIVRMKELSRRHIWWPGIDEAIKEVAKRCSAYQRSNKDPGMVTLLPWAWPDTPFQMIHVTFAGPFLETNFSGGRLFEMDGGHTDV